MIGDRWLRSTAPIRLDWGLPLESANVHQAVNEPSSKRLTPGKTLRRPSLRSHLNQIRLWVRQGRTDAWIAHKLDISVEQLQTFKRDQGLNAESEPAASPPPVDLASIDEIDVATDEEEEEEGALSFGDALDIPEPEPSAEAEEAEPAAENGDQPEQPERQDEPERTPRRRRGRRGGRRRSGRTAAFEATFDHGDEGYGLWLDPAVAKDAVYSEHWAGHRAVSVTVEPDAITIRRVEADGSNSENGD